jgi:hypothetical protein
MFYHRPANPALFRGEEDAFRGALRRRFDPRTLPPSLVQVIGHIGHGKCLTLLGSWAVRAEVDSGTIRHLRTDGTVVHYRAGWPDDDGAADTAAAADSDVATLVFIDGQMSRCEPLDYEILDLSRLAAFITNADRA